MNEFLTLDFLKTFAGAVFAVTLIVNFTKKVVIKPYFSDAFIKIYALLWSWIILGFVVFLQNNITVETAGLAFLNGILVTWTAMGLHETITDFHAEKHK